MDVKHFARFSWFWKFFFFSKREAFSFQKRKASLLLPLWYKILWILEFI